MATNTWSHTVGNNWNSAGNWSLGHVPQAGEDVVFDATSTADCTLDAYVFANLGSVTFADAYSGTFAFGTSWLTSADSVYFGTGMTVTPGTGNVRLNAAAAATHQYPPESRMTR